MYINDNNLYRARLFGEVDGSTLQNLGVEGTVSGESEVGGLAGRVSKGKILNCYSSVAVNSSDNTGGVVGFITGSTVSNCYATGAVSGNVVAGGIVGNINNSTVTNCYATGAVSGNDKVGGIAGVYYTGSGSFINCAALNPSVTRILGAETTFGRVISDYNGVTLPNNLAFSGMALPSDATGWNGIDLTAANAKTEATYSGMGWKFGIDDANPWKMGVGTYGLPVFYWQTTAPAAMPAHLQ